MDSGVDVRAIDGSGVKVAVPGYVVGVPNAVAVDVAVGARSPGFAEAVGSDSVCVRVALTVIEGVTVGTEFGVAEGECIGFAVGKSLSEVGVIVGTIGSGVVLAPPNATDVPGVGPRPGASRDGMRAAPVREAHTINTTPSRVRAHPTR
ncbi:MAG: hypothetical protein ACP5GX_00080 [Anaerolineae bacterium]